ncbi:MAG: hypothetical protein M1820_000126 [Bogoriella megaspora]|nr:MAG: hypothetical protein M1820_000126 [Bogoriella megaspora]
MPSSSPDTATTKTASSDRAYLLGLPLELLYEIFSYIVPHETRERDKLFGRQIWFIPRDFKTSIFRVNRMISAAALSYMYKSTFYIDLDVWGWDIHLGGYDESGDRHHIGFDWEHMWCETPAADLIQRCSLTIPMHWIDDDGYIHSNIQEGMTSLVNFLLRARGLRYLHVELLDMSTAMSRKDVSKEDVETFLGKLRRLKGINKVEIGPLDDKKFLEDLERDMMSEREG